MSTLAIIIQDIADLRKRLFDSRGRIKLTKQEIQLPYPDPENVLIGVNTHKLTVDSVAPSDPQVGDIWIDIT